MRLIQYVTETKKRCVGVVSGDQIHPLKQITSVYELASKALAENTSLIDLVTQLQSTDADAYATLIADGRLLSPYDHPDTAHMYITGTGLTHLGSADTRASMHAQTSKSAQAEVTDSMKMFKMGLENGKPKAGQTGVQPEWFYKGNGSIVVAPGKALVSPGFALDAGEEPEIAGLYINDEQGRPHRIGFTLGNEFSDHITEKENYLFLAHSKLRQCSFGPEILIGELPADIKGYSRIYRNNEVVWEKEFLSGEDNMSHTIANLEHHHFKYSLFCQPKDAHVHFFGTATLSFGDGVETEAGDIFEIESTTFGQPLRNPLAIDEETGPVFIQPL